MCQCGMFPLQPGLWHNARTGNETSHRQCRRKTTLRRGSLTCSRLSWSSPVEPGIVLLHHTAIHALAVPFGMQNNSTSVSTITVAAEMCGQ